MNSDPLKCAIVLGTLTDDNTLEYRIGKFENKEQLLGGLCMADASAKRPYPLRLRHTVAQRCFAGSDIYPGRNEAVRAADELYPNHQGIKVITLACSFPSI